MSDMNSALERDLFGPFTLSRGDDGIYTFSAQLIDEADTVEISAAQRERLQQLCDDVWLRLELEVPGEIVSSTAHETRERRVAWELDPGRNPGSLTVPPPVVVSFR